jgi:hypothetical protein
MGSSFLSGLRTLNDPCKTRKSFDNLLVHWNAFKKLPCIDKLQEHQHQCQLVMKCFSHQTVTIYLYIYITSKILHNRTLLTFSVKQTGALDLKSLLMNIHWNLDYWVFIGPSLQSRTTHWFFWVLLRSCYWCCKKVTQLQRDMGICLVAHWNLSWKATPNQSKVAGAITVELESKLRPKPL